MFRELLVLCEGNPPVTGGCSSQRASWLQCRNRFDVKTSSCCKIAVTILSLWENEAASVLETWWRHQMEISSALLVLCAENSQVASQSHWRRALIFSSICGWTNGWVNNRDAGDLRRRSAYYDVTVMNQRLVEFPTFQTLFNDHIAEHNARIFNVTQLYM